MSDMIRVRLTQQMSGTRYDGRAWPAWGEEFEIPEWEYEGSRGLYERVTPPTEERVPEPRPAETRTGPEATPLARAARATSGQPRGTRG